MIWLYIVRYKYDWYIRNWDKILPILLIQYIWYPLCVARARFVLNTCNVCRCLLTLKLQHRCTQWYVESETVISVLLSLLIVIWYAVFAVQCMEWENERLLHCIKVWFYVMSPFFCAVIILVRPVLPARIGTFHMPLISVRICLFPVTGLLLLNNTQIGNITLIFWHAQAIRLSVVNHCKCLITTITA